MNALLRLAAWTLAIALVALPMIAVLNGWIGGERWPMRRLLVTGEFAQVADAQVRAAVLPAVRGGFFALDLDAVRDAVAALPWVASVQVRKRWPDRLEVSLTEHRPVAHWGDDEMLAESGQLFLAPDVAAPTLPHFSGPIDRIGDVLAFHAQAREQFQRQGLRIAELALSARGSWHLRLDSGQLENGQLENGLEVEVGREQTAERLARFARLLPKLRQDEPRSLRSADLRYTNGFALVWRPIAIPTPAPNPPSSNGAGSNLQARS